jgi:predicted dehydrogenase
MNVTIIGSGQHADVRRRVVEARSGAAQLVQHARVPDLAEQDPAAALPNALFEDTDVALVTVPTASHYYVAQAAARHGVHLFLEWPPATSIRECESIVQLAEEAGVEVGISRPLRFHPLLDALDGRRVHLIVLRQEVDARTPAFWPPRCADALDLCCALARSHSIQRIDAEAVPRHAAWPEAIAFALRFHSGTYAQVSLYRRQQPGDDLLYVAGADFQLESDLDGTALHGRPALGDAATSDVRSPVEQETTAFLDALTADQIPPVTVLDGLHTMRLVERLMEQLR